MAEVLPVPEDLDTPEACLRYVRSLLRRQARFESHYEAVRCKAKAEGDEVSLVIAYVRMNRLRDSTADLIFQVTERMARLASEA